MTFIEERVRTTVGYVRYGSSGFSFQLISFNFKRLILSDQITLTKNHMHKLSRMKINIKTVIHPLHMSIISVGVRSSPACAISVFTFINMHDLVTLHYFLIVNKMHHVIIIVIVLTMNIYGFFFAYFYALHIQTGSVIGLY